MQSLAELSVKKLPLTQIWEEDILQSALPREVKTEAAKKFTLDNLYHEGELHEDVDYDLFYLCLKNHVGTGPVWKAAFNKLGLPLNDWITADINDQNVVTQIAAKYNVSLADLKEALQEGVGVVLLEIINWLDHPGLAFVYGDVTFALEYQRKKIWRLLIMHFADVDEDNNNTDVKSSLVGYTLLDQALARIYRYIRHYGQYEPFENFGEHLQPESLSNQSKKVLETMLRVLKVDQRVEDIWTTLKDRAIIIYSQPEFSTKDLRENTVLVRIGDYLHILKYDYLHVLAYDDSLDGIKTYPQEDAFLILVPLTLDTNDDVNVWEYLKNGLN